MQKNDCQQILGRANLPIPVHAVLTRLNLGKISTILEQSKVGVPMVLKPTVEAGSVGVALAKTMEEAIKNAQQILAKFPLSEVITETFLPSENITCGFLQLGDQVMFVVAYQVFSKSVLSKSNIMSLKERLQEWDEHDKVQPHVIEPETLMQFERYIPQIIEVLKIEDISCIDGCLDATGHLHFFDVNGLPALNLSESATNNQCFNCFSDYSKEKVSKALIHTIVYNALLIYGMKLPQAFKDSNMFTMQSNRVMKVSLAVSQFPSKFIIWKMFSACAR